MFDRDELPPTVREVYDTLNQQQQAIFRKRWEQRQKQNEEIDEDLTGSTEMFSAMMRTIKGERKSPRAFVMATAQVASRVICKLHAKECEAQDEPDVDAILSRYIGEFNRYLHETIRANLDTMEATMAVEDPLDD